MSSIYLIGSLRNPSISQVSSALRRAGHDVFDDWYAAGPMADDHWQQYEEERGRRYAAALDGYAARHVFGFDKEHLDRCDVGVLVLPAGKSAHAELGYMKGLGKQTYVLLEEADPKRWDVMYLLFDGVCQDVDELLVELGPQVRAPVAADPFVCPHHPIGYTCIARDGERWCTSPGCDWQFHPERPYR